MSVIKVNKIENTGTTNNGISINSTGQVTVPSITGNVSMVSGNLVLASGQGIDFSATGNSSGTTSSELLSDYEEGTWTPTISGNTLDTSAGHSEYTKIGHRVFFQTHFNLGSNPGDTFNIGGLPFTTSSTSRSAISIVVNDASNSYAQVGGQTATLNESVTTIACDMHGTITLANDDRINLSGSYLV